MSLSELVSRIKQSSAIGALIISMYKGNPGAFQLVSPDGNEILHANIESALLRREVSPKKETRITSIRRIYTQQNSSDSTMLFASVIAETIGVPLITIDAVEDFEDGSIKESYMWFQTFPDGKTLWTHYNSSTKTEIGPRVRAFNIGRNIVEES